MLSTERIEPIYVELPPIENVNNPLSTEAKSQLVKKLERLYPAEIITKIISGYESNWINLVKKNAKNPTLYEQIHSIKGLKIYLDRQTQRLVADIAIGEIGKGNNKRAKCEYKIRAEGTCRPMVRYCKCKVSLDEKGRDITQPQLLAEKFSLDIQNELDMRAKLRPNPHTLPLVHSGSYLNKKGLQKERYEAPFCDGNLCSLVDSISTKVKKRIQALFICRDSISALAALHKQGFVHKDIKPENIFYQGCKGFLADLAFATLISNPPVPRGAFLYKAPEDIGQNDPQVEMFSVGATLLEIFRQDLYDEFYQIKEDFYSSQKDWLTRSSAGKQRLRDLQKKLLENRDGTERSALNDLIAHLIDLDLTKRPCSAKTHEKLKSIAEGELKKARDLNISFDDADFRGLTLTDT